MQREFALLSLPAARAAGLINARCDLADHSLTPDVLRGLAFAVVADADEADDALETRAPAVVAEHGLVDAVAAQVAPDVGIADLTFWNFLGDPC